MRLEVLVTEAAFAPGRSIQGVVRVLEGGRARQIAVSLRQCERSPGYTHVAREIPGPVLHRGDLAGGEWLDFTLTIPQDAVAPQQLHHGEVYWDVAATCDRTGPDVSATARLAEPSAA
jgi:hypothetical protein